MFERTFFMISHRLQAKSPHIIGGFGVILFLIGVIHHSTEISTLDQLVGPLIAGLLDGALALGVVYTGYRLGETGLSPKNRWQVCKWCFLGATLFTAVMGLSILVRAIEGRFVGEAIFPLLIAAESGAIAGVIVGYYTVRSQVEARKVRSVNDALSFVNSLIRHDLRNDLNVIHGHADLLDAQMNSVDAETENLSVITEKTEEALTRIETTGAVAKTLTGEPELERVDLVTITTEMATQARNTYDVTVTTSLPDQALVIANAGLRSVVDNLFENAIEHNDADTPEVHATVEASGETVQLVISDNGPGIPEEHKESILHSENGGTEGGGLSLVQTLVEGYGGKVQIEDNNPRGSKFIVELPRNETDLRC